jgi:UDP-N-acetylglucosamine 2-epimerase
LHGRVIIRLIDDYVKRNPLKAYAFASMGQRWYLSTLSYMDAIVGNSSSGIIEAPSFGIPTVNIGDRQKGRIKAESVLDCTAEKGHIVNALNMAFSTNFRIYCRTVKSPYGNGSASRNALSILKKELPAIDLKKKFYSFPWTTGKNPNSTSTISHG